MLLTHVVTSILSMYERMFFWTQDKSEGSQTIHNKTMAILLYNSQNNCLLLSTIPVEKENKTSFSHLFSIFCKGYKGATKWCGKRISEDNGPVFALPCFLCFMDARRLRRGVEHLPFPFLTTKNIHPQKV